MESMCNFDRNIKVLIISPYTASEIMNSSFGGAKLIKMQKNYFKNGNILYLSDIGSVTSFFINFGSKKKNHNNNYQSKKSENRWFLNLVFIIFMYFISNIDFIWKKRLYLSLISEKPDTILCNYPIFFNSICSISNKLGINCVLLEHNVEYSFFEQIVDGRIENLLIVLLKKIEHYAIKRSYMTLVVTSKDREILLKDLEKEYSYKIFQWIPFDYQKYTKDDIEDIQNNASIEDKNFLTNMRNSKIIGFIGAYFEPNIVAVGNIIKIAKTIDDNDIIFLIIGKVCYAFNDRKDIPNNIFMKGFVENLDFYLSICSAFINPKTTSDTGVEIKMFDYLKFDKPIISTEMGARGFEEFKNIIISNNIADISKIILRL